MPKVGERGINNGKRVWTDRELLIQLLSHMGVLDARVTELTREIRKSLLDIELKSSFAPIPVGRDEADIPF